MKKLYYVIFFLSFIQFFAQQKDTLSKYTLKEITKISNESYIRGIGDNSIAYCEEILLRNPEDSLKADTYLKLGELYFYKNSDLNEAIKITNKGLVYAKKSNQVGIQRLCFIYISIYYALGNKYKEALKNISTLKKLEDPNFKIDYEYLINEDIDVGKIYYLLGDFEMSANICKKKIKQIDDYISSNSQLSEKQLKELIRAKLFFYQDLIYDYNYQKKTDSAFYYLQDAKVLKKRYNVRSSLWVQETLYLIICKKYDQAIARIDKATQKHKDSKLDIYKANYYYAVCYKEKKEFAKSLKYCEEALKYKVITMTFLNFELEIYRLAALNAEKIGNVEKKNFYSKKYNERVQEINYQDKAAFIAKLYDQDLVLMKQELKSEKKRKVYFYYILVLLVIVFGCLYLYHYIQSKKDHEKFKKIIADIENEKINNTLVISDSIEKNIHQDQLITLVERQPVNMSNEADEKIIKQLNSFEKKKLFLSPNVSLSSLAVNFNTNVAYLSAVIKKYKTNNFNGYINDLRIDYIIVKLKTCPGYLNYKIAYLAEECGFASHAVFIRIFTKKTGLTPSKFISFLKDDQSENLDVVNEN